MKSTIKVPINIWITIDSDVIADPRTLDTDELKKWVNAKRALRQALRIFLGENTYASDTVAEQLPDGWELIDIDTRSGYGRETS